MDFCDLPVEVPRHQGLAEKLDAVQFGLDTTSAMPAAPTFPDGSTKIVRRMDYIVAGDGPRARRFPRFDILARGYGGMSATGSNRIKTFARVTGAICRYRSDVLIGWDLVQQLRQHGCVADISGGHFDGPNLQRFRINTDMYLAPDTPLGSTMFAGVPFAPTLGFDPRAIDQEVQRTSAPAIGLALSPNQ